MKKYRILLGLFLFFFAVQRTPFSQSYDFGVNLAGAEFADSDEDPPMPGQYGVEYTYPTEAELDYYHSKNMNLIRLPFRWERVQHTFGGVLNTDDILHIKDVVHWAEARGMSVLLDMHNYGRYKDGVNEMIIGELGLTVNDVKDVWTKLANEFKDEPNVWGYGIMNEPHDMLASTSWFSIAQEIINGIRSVDSSTAIVVGGDGWSSAGSWIETSDNLKNLIDSANHLIFEAHIYFDLYNEGLYANSYQDEQATPTTGVERATPFVTWLQDNNLRGFVGEYGCPGDDPNWLVTLENLLIYLQDNCVNGTYWAGGPWWGFDFMSVEPIDTFGESDPVNGEDKPQMEILQNYPQTSISCGELGLNLKVFLEGSYNLSNQAMDDFLRQNNWLPLTEPFTALGFNHVNGGGESVEQSVLDLSGDDAIVDWIFVEFRDANSPSAIVATQSALLQRDGDIVDVDGTSAVTFPNVNTAQVLVVLRHRNHLGVRAMNSYATNQPIAIDFTDPTTSLFGLQPMIDIGTVRAMIAGDANNDGQVNPVDKNDYWRVENGQPFDYINSKADFNLDGVVNPVDLNGYWRLNNSRIEQLE